MQESMFKESELKRRRLLIEKEARPISYYIASGCKAMPNFAHENFSYSQHCPKIEYVSCVVHKAKGITLPKIDEGYPGGLKKLYSMGK